MYFPNTYGNRSKARRHGMRGQFLAACIGLAAVGRCGSPAVASEAASTSTAFISFNIGAQPLSSALDAYSAATGLQVVYDGTLAEGLSSKPILGSMLPDLALRNLLEGTGLVADYAANVFTIVRAPAAQPRATANIDGFMPYLAVIQGRVEQAFCRSSLTRPGGYRIKFRFWIGAGGEILRPQLIGSTEDGVRDDAITRALGRLAIDRPPPPDMPQPVVMAITAHPLADTGDCRLVGTASGGRAVP